MSFASFLKKLMRPPPATAVNRPQPAPPALAVDTAPARIMDAKPKPSAPPAVRAPLPTAENVTVFFGRPVKDYDWNQPATDIDAVVYRIRIDFETSETGSIAGGDKAKTVFLQVFERFLASPNIEGTTALVIGDWGGASTGETSAGVVKALAQAKSKLPSLKALFLGDLVMEESEISWINQSDLSPLWQAYPRLELLQLRGGTGLSLKSLSLPSLHTLVIQTGGLSGEVVRQVGVPNLPELTHLELWLGSDNYGGDSTVADLKPILDGSVFPKLDYLGLRDCEYADKLAAALANAPILERVNTLDLSLGTLSDAGGAALLTAAKVKRLRCLDLHYHYLSSGMISKLAALGVTVDLSEQQESDDDDDRYCAVSE